MILEVAGIVMLQNDPAVVARLVFDPGVAGIGKSEIRSLEVGMGHHADQGMHDHI